MGMSTYLIGYKPADEKWYQMKAVWDACESAGIEVPDDVIDFFDDVYPGDAPGMEVKLKSPAVEEWCDNYREGIQVDLSLLPPDVKYLRFINSY
jgi:hypothetical protein